MMNKLKEYLQEQEALRPLLLKVAKRYHQKGQLTGRQKLADSLEHYQLLCSVFGMSCLKLNTKNQTTIHYDRFFEMVDPSTWLLELHQALDLPITTREAEEKEQQRLRNNLLKAWSLKHPQRASLTNHLQQDVAKWLSDQNNAQVLEQWDCALQIYDFLRENKRTIGISELSAQFTGNSKSLRHGPILPLVAQWLAITVNEPQPTTAKERQALFRQHGLLINLTTVKVTLSGPLVYKMNGKDWDWIKKLSEEGQSATLSLENLAEIEQFTLPQQTRIITCENEAPFVQLSHLAEDNLVIYTEGNPNHAVLQLLDVLTPNPCHHWGDSDLNGLRIAARLAQRFPLELWRCDLASLQKNKPWLITMSEKMRAQSKAFLAKEPAFPFRKELEFSLEHGWLEQESWRGP